MTFRILGVLAIAALTAPLPLHADEVSDALQAAVDAYASGNLGATASSLTMAKQALGNQQSALLAALLPAAPDGWTVTPSEDFTLMFDMMGGGSGAEARYANADGSVSFTLSFIADNPMVGSMGAMLGNTQMMAMMGKVVMVGDQPVLEADGSLSTLIAARVLFQAQGAATEVMLPVVQLIDFAKVGVFDTK